MSWIYACTFQNANAIEWMTLRELQRSHKEREKIYYFFLAELLRKGGKSKLEGAPVGTHNTRWPRANYAWRDAHFTSNYTSYL